MARVFERASGLLLHVTSLPGGRLGDEAFRFVDFCEKAGQRWWQVLPVGPPGPGRSPYTALSAFAGHEKLIRPEPPEDAGFEAFRKAERHWLPDYALFRALRQAHGRRSWTDWPAALRNRKKEALADARDKHARAILNTERRQYAFDVQWGQLREYARERGVRLMGDLPLFVAHDSADVWAHRELFKLDKHGRPKVVTGVPPDYFSKDGQRWGNPHYDWAAVKRLRFRWWIARLRRLFDLFDAVRLDHFLGLLRAWEIPRRSKTARRGHWAPGPGAAFLKAVRRELPGARLIAEDLGLVTEESDALREEFGLPGMRVLQFSFGADPAERPHAFPRNCAAYTGTHDNNTTVGWYEEGGRDRERARIYAGCRKSRIHWGMIRLAQTSRCDLAITPVQDVLGLDARARMNRPGRSKGNWRWRMKKGALKKRHADRLRAITEAAGR